MIGMEGILTQEAVVVVVVRATLATLQEQVDQGSELKEWVVEWVERLIHKIFSTCSLEGVWAMGSEVVQHSRLVDLAV